MVFLMYSIPILFGFVCGYCLSLPVNVFLTIMASSIGLYLYQSTAKAELGAIIGMVAMMFAVIYSVALWVTIAIINHTFFSFNLSWILR